jgi:hypothetical protein
MQCKDIPDLPVLQFLKQHEGRWCTWGDGYSMPTIQDAMPEGTPCKLQRAKMKTLIKRNLVDGCGCGCRGDFKITRKGIELIENNTLSSN